jgi:threonine dehydrogenase-like Zn-dependent dehydrogenase
MRGAVLYGPRDVRFEERDAPKIIKPTDAIIRLAATCVCGSDLWPYRGIQATAEPTPMGHEYCGVVEEVGSAVRSVKPGQFVIGSFFASDNTCPHCHAGYQTSCQQREFVGGAQAPLLRVPLADGTLVATPGAPSEELIEPALDLRRDGHGLVRSRRRERQGRRDGRGGRRQRSRGRSASLLVHMSGTTSRPQTTRNRST